MVARSSPKGRGAPGNAQSSRFNLPQRDADGDWLDAIGTIDDGPPPLRTTVTIEHPRSIISRNTSPDVIHLAQLVLSLCTSLFSGFFMPLDLL